MKKLVPFEVEGGRIFIEAEADDDADGGARRVGRTGGEAVGGDKRFAEAIARVKPAAEAVLKTFREINAPAEIGLEFGIKFNAKVGAVFASADSEATFKVSLNRQRSRQQAWSFRTRPTGNNPSPVADPD